MKFLFNDLIKDLTESNRGKLVYTNSDDASIISLALKKAGQVTHRWYITLERKLVAPTEYAMSLNIRKFIYDSTPVNSGRFDSLQLYYKKKYMEALAPILEDQIGETLSDIWYTADLL